MNFNVKKSKCTNSLNIIKVIDISNANYLPFLKILLTSLDASFSLQVLYPAQYFDVLDAKYMHVGSFAHFFEHDLVLENLLSKTKLFMDTHLLFKDSSNSKPAILSLEPGSGLASHCFFPIFRIAEASKIFNPICYFSTNVDDDNKSK